jgi:hypothetical protein
LISIKRVEASGGNIHLSEYLRRNNSMRVFNWLATAFFLASAGAFAASGIDLYKDPG